MADEILVQQDGPILRITLNAPDRGNAVTDDNVRELTRLINGAGRAATTSLSPKSSSKPNKPASPMKTGP